jgi:hypothetical protein
MSRIVIVILIYHRHKPIDSINLFTNLMKLLSKKMFKISACSAKKVLASSW